MYCNHCGNYLQDRDRFCTRCGSARPGWLPPTEQQGSPIHQVTPQPPRETHEGPAWMHNYTQPPQTQIPFAPRTDKREKRREGEIGRNLFAVLASLLILIGVGIFIATIYETIPMMVKVLVIYVLGIAMLGVGLALYRRNKNYFWLGIASCGMAELLICIIESYSYFVIITLPAAFGLILMWILVSFLLTNVHPVVFKSIGFIGLVISIWLGMSQLHRSDLLPFLCMLGCYAAISFLFLITNRSCVITNTIIAFGSLLNLISFLMFPFFLPEGMSWISFLTALVLIAAYHAIYILTKLPKNGIPFFAGLASLVLWVFSVWQDSSLTVPILAGTILVQWILCHALDVGKVFRIFFTAFAGVFMAVLSLITLILAHSYGEASWYWYAIFTVAAYVAYFLTKKQDIAWLGLSVFIYLLFHVTGELSLGYAVAFIIAVVIFLLTSIRNLQVHCGLQGVWYVLVLLVANVLLEKIALLIPFDPGASYQLRDIADDAFETILLIVNTLYLHRCLTKYQKITPKLLLLLIIQGNFLLNSLGSISDSFWVCSILGVVTSLLIISCSIHYVYITKAENKGLLIWQFIKFTVYCMYITSHLNCPNIVGHILLLLIAIVAVLIGFRLDRKAVRTYGLVLALIDVAVLVFDNINYGNSLQLSLGIVVCGILCFGMSFLYSWIARTSVDKNEGEQTPAEDVEQ